MSLGRKMKAVMISIQPKWAEKILNGEKTIEVRKTRPILETPFKCYIYETKESIKRWLDHRFNSFHANKSHYSEMGKVIGEFVCDKIYEFESEFWNDETSFQCIGQVYYDEDDNDREVDIFVTNSDADYKSNILCKQSCVSWEELRKYVGTGIKTFYAWHISDLKIYDKPKEISEFRTPPCEKSESSCERCKYLVKIDTPCTYEVDCFVENGRNITRPPQSWCYVEEKNQ